MSSSRLLPLLTTGLTALVLSACTTPDDSSPAADDDGALDVVASFYPLEFATNRIVGDLATVETLTSPGVDPHDVEISPQTVAGVQEADLVIYSSGLQPAVDEAVESQAADHSLDVNEVADLIDTGTEDVHDHGAEGEDEHADEDAHTEDTHSEEEHADEEAHTDEDEHTEDEHTEEEHGPLDPHFWLDPARMASASQAIADELASVDPENADTYQANADDLIADLTALKEDYDTGLASCSQVDMVTTHSAFGYIAEPYGFHQIGVTGLAPEAEPSPARLAEVTEIVQESGIDTIYSEILLGADIAETVAAETGAEVMLLDPIEGLTEESPGEDYLEIMQANLETLREGQGCS